ncbi:MULTISPECIES: hypothetical protein [unclassified Methylobacterium]|uniref:hypothetical protein n=1 Tax=unclassified Methylobacterium TaxID=2615210 RepID=UPI001F2772CA|nr:MULTISPECIES: hypothetical protein [Methylobacterium]WFT81019.1 hypothetical protein QA634_03700 [Methylobacterium nodulans]
MSSVMFTFGEHTPEHLQDTLGDRIKQIPGVRSVGRISPGAKKPELRRLWYAEVLNSDAASALVAQLREQDGIVSAELPAERGLI